MNEQEYKNAMAKAYSDGYNEATNKALEFMKSHAYDYKFMGDQCIEDFTKFMKGYLEAVLGAFIGIIIYKKYKKGDDNEDETI